MASLSIEERLLHYFLAMGAQQVAEKPPSATLSFVISDQRVNVVVARNDVLTQSTIIEAILGLATLRASSNQVYLAAPRLLGVTIDAQLFRSYGIGLLLYDDRRIDEAVAPQVVQFAQPVPTMPTQDPSTVAEITELKSMYLEMKSTLVRLREEMQTLQHTPKEPPISSIDMPQHVVIQQQPSFSESAGQLPSFFTNNPWLDVLSKRGRGNGEPFAG